MGSCAPGSEAHANIRTSTLAHFRERFETAPWVTGNGSHISKKMVQKVLPMLGQWQLLTPLD